jgi:hypothetical protein
MVVIEEPDTGREVVHQKWIDETRDAALLMCNCRIGGGYASRRNFVYKR